ncbi:M14 family metallopeptidase [Rapidithrix thailandica]|uniref:M14 family metallopeptidase n=1 Tax=Rapidithrix thailandica TaxID=413964 RepID=A0AAW9S3X2_9BACT
MYFSTKNPVRWTKRIFTFFWTCLIIPLAQAQEILPPNLSWKGKSEKLIVKKKHPWITPAEQSGFERSPSYLETVQWFQKMADASELIEMRSIGKSYNGRDIYMITASLEKEKSPETLSRSPKPLLLVQAGIHAGEIDGKDAGMMLLRDIAFGPKKGLLQNVNFLFVPILSVDGHERSSSFNRVNQRGPHNMGWRTNARNQNLNRDYTKLDTKELRAVLQVIRQYHPDLYIDIHVTDGADYQYDITYGHIGTHGYSPAIANWLKTQYTPAVNQGLQAMGHIPGPLLFALNYRDFSQGNIEYTFGPNFSHGYGDLRHLPTILVENHSLKPFRQRVLGTYVFLENTLEVLAKQHQSLQQAIASDQQRRPQQIPLTWQVPQLNNPTNFGDARAVSLKPQEAITPPDTLNFLGIASEIKTSEITGGEYLRWLGQPKTMKVVNYVMSQASSFVERPKAYWIPAAWQDVIQRLKIHGMEMETLKEAKEVTVEMYRIQEHQLSSSPKEGRVQVKGKAVPEMYKEIFPAGSVRIDTDQPLGDLAALLLEPGSPDSFFQWGFFLEIFSRTEYIEAYAIEPLAQKMLEESPEVRKKFEQKKKQDPEFAANPRAILNWFYQQSPYYDQRYLLYPVGREL